MPLSEEMMEDAEELMLSALYCSNEVDKGGKPQPMVDCGGGRAKNLGLACIWWDACVWFDRLF